MSNEVESKIAKLGFELPPAPDAVGFYVPVVKFGNLIVTSGQLPIRSGNVVFTGKVGDEIHETEGYDAARICALNALAQIKACVGDFDRVKQIIRIEGYVHSAPGFQGQPSVLNGASEFLVEVLGERGKHTRTAVGVCEMPLNAAVQLAVWAEVEDAGSET